MTDADIQSDVFEDSWARLPLLNRAQLDADGQRRYDVIVNPDSRYADGPWGPVAMWMYSPLMVEHIFPAGTHLRFGTQKDPRLTELAILSTARKVRSQYEWSVHEPVAVAAGLEPEIVDIVKRRTPLDAVDDVPGLGERERTIIQFAREVVSDEHLSSPTFAQAWALFGDKGVMMATTSTALGGSALIVAGIYQWTPLKGASLQHCQSPLQFISRHWRPGPTGTLRMGWEHGLYCLGCCWILMCLLFVGGVMNLLWIAGLALFVLLEKVLAGRWVPVAGGVILVIWGTLVLTSPG